MWSCIFYFLFDNVTKPKLCQIIHNYQNQNYFHDSNFSHFCRSCIARIALNMQMYISLPFYQSKLKATSHYTQNCVGKHWHKNGHLVIFCLIINHWANIFAEYVSTSQYCLTLHCSRILTNIHNRCSPYSQVHSSVVVLLLLLLSC